jgi:hypothetical protein
VKARPKNVAGGNLQADRGTKTVHRLPDTVSGRIFSIVLPIAVDPGSCWLVAEADALALDQPPQELGGLPGEPLDRLPGIDGRGGSTPMSRTLTDWPSRRTTTVSPSTTRSTRAADAGESVADGRDGS